jgi:hypothetical protein
MGIVPVWYMANESDSLIRYFLFRDMARLLIPYTGLLGDKAGPGEYPQVRTFSVGTKITF